MTKKKPEPKDVPPNLFVPLRNWWINYLVNNVDEFYKFGSSSQDSKNIPNIEAINFKYLVKRLLNGMRTKYPDLSEQDLHGKVCSSDIGFKSFV